jgi:hypothetical protein
MNDGKTMNITEFARYLYERPIDGTEWYFSDEHEDLNLQKDQLVQLAAQAFSDVAKAANQFDEKQVCMGLRYLVNPSCSPIPYLYLDASIDFSIRSNAIMSMQALFQNLFANLSSEHALYQASGGSPLSYRETCYMWWEMFPRHGVPRRADMEETDAIICQTISSILEIDNLACQESALHGLGHWFSSRPNEVSEAIKSFLPHAPVALKEYAINAMQGRVQ